jgi:hypothetical protein
MSETLMKRCLTALLFVLLAAGVCAAQAARVGRKFELKVGRVVTLDGGSLRLRFARVASDSRCPEDVDCVWAGNAEVLVEAGARGWQGKRTLTLNTDAGGQGAPAAKYGSYTVRLVNLSPRPRSDRKIPSGRYTATLLVSKE